MPISPRSVRSVRCASPSCAIARPSGFAGQHRRRRATERDQRVLDLDRFQTRYHGQTVRAYLSVASDVRPRHHGAKPPLGAQKAVVAIDGELSPFSISVRRFITSMRHWSMRSCRICWLRGLSTPTRSCGDRRPRPWAARHSDDGTEDGQFGCARTARGQYRGSASFPRSDRGSLGGARCGLGFAADDERPCAARAPPARSL